MAIFSSTVLPNQISPPVACLISQSRRRNYIRQRSIAYALVSFVPSDSDQRVGMCIDETMGIKSEVGRSALKLDMLIAVSNISGLIYTLKRLSSVFARRTWRNCGSMTKTQLIDDWRKMSNRDERNSLKAWTWPRTRSFSGVKRTVWLRTMVSWKVNPALLMCHVSRQPRVSTIISRRPLPNTREGR